MISLIAFLLTLAGSANWFCIAVMQYDFVAGMFGSQANLFSRIVYGIIGLSAIWLIYAIIRGKGKIKIDGKRATDRELLGKNKKKKENKNGTQEEQKDMPQATETKTQSNPEMLSKVNSEASNDAGHRENSYPQSHNENTENASNSNEDNNDMENEKHTNAMDSNSFYNNNNESEHTQKINKTDN